jgi:hypothetical protein
VLLRLVGQRFVNIRCGATGIGRREHTMLVLIELRLSSH